MSDDKKNSSPRRTMLVLKDKDGREVGRMPATAPNVEAYLADMGRRHGGLTVDYVDDPDAGLLAALWKWKS